MARTRADDRYEGAEKSAVGARLELTRQAFGLDQRSFATRAGLKVPTYNQYETGTNLPKISAGIALCDAYGITLDWIYRGDPSGLSYKLHDAIAHLRRIRDE